MSVPFPVVVGVPRSGTTMLRLMLDAHSQLAIPPETGFLLDPAVREGIGGPVEVGRRIVRFPQDAPAWPDFGLDADEFLAALGALRPNAGTGDTLRVFYGLYSRRHGKPRAGDKTPAYLLAMREVATALPEARFIHLVRDGRDVAVSWRERWFAPFRDAADLVREWRRQVEMARMHAEGLAYVEVRFEELVRDPESVLRRICENLELSFDPTMLRYHERAAERLSEHGPRIGIDGDIVVTQDERRRQQRHTTLPPDQQRIGIWRSVLTAGEAAACERAGGPLLRSLEG